MQIRSLILLTLLALPTRGFASATPVDPATWKQELSTLRATKETDERWVREAELLYRIGLTTDDETEKRKLFEEGLNLAQRARAENPKNPGALFQWVVHSSSIAAIDKNLEALRQIKVIEGTLLELKAVDPAYGQAAADRALGRLYDQAPMIISVGSTPKALKHLRAAYDRAPSFPGNCLFLADTLLRTGDKREARKLVKSCPISESDAQHPDAPEWARIARRILDRT